MKFEDLPERKRCKSCGETKPGHEFYFAKGRGDKFNLASFCTKCCAERVTLSRQRAALETGGSVLLPADEVKRLYRRIAEQQAEIKRNRQCMQLLRKAAEVMAEVE